LNKIVSPK